MNIDLYKKFLSESVNKMIIEYNISNKKSKNINITNQYITYNMYLNNTISL